MDRKGQPEGNLLRDNVEQNTIVMAEENAIKPLKSLTIKTEETEVNRFNRMKEELGMATAGQMLTELLDRMEQPQRVADNSKALQARIESLQAELQTALERKGVLEGQVAELQVTMNSNAEAATHKELEMQQQLESMALKENQVVVSFTPDNLKVLDLVCARESKRRNQQWSRSHVINYFINARFVRGVLNGDLQSIADSELKRLGVSLKNPGKEDFEL